jgi:hypothetical protein
VTENLAASQERAEIEMCRPPPAAALSVSLDAARIAEMSDSGTEAEQAIDALTSASISVGSRIFTRPKANQKHVARQTMHEI